MKSDRNYRIYLEDMLSATEKALSFVQGLDEDSFGKNEEKVYAVIRALEILGEAAKHIPLSVRRKHPGVPWQKIAGTRDRLIHAYFDIHINRLWTTVMNDLPRLRGELQTILAVLEKGSAD